MPVCSVLAPKKALTSVLRWFLFSDMDFWKFSLVWIHTRHLLSCDRFGDFPWKEILFNKNIYRCQDLTLTKRYLRVRFHLCGAVAERSPLSGADFWVSVFSCCVFPLWRCVGGAEAGVRGDSAEWVLEPFFRSALQSGSGLETIGINSLEAAILILKILLLNSRVAMVMQANGNFAQDWK